MSLPTSPSVVLSSPAAGVAGIRHHPARPEQHPLSVAPTARYIIEADPAFEPMHDDLDATM
ncbi:MAG: hypothetical protein ACI8RZ_005712 [Myxococcota bacterium]|jgi:hypothetical protein